MESKTTFTWQGDISVLDALFVRKKNIEQGRGRDADGKTFGILFNGGGQRGALMAGIALALEDAGLTNMFDHAIGCSVGALCVWYFCSGEAHKGVSVYTKVDHHYIRHSHPWKVLDLKIIDYIIRKENPIDIGRLRAFPGKIHVGLTDAQSGEGVFVDPRTFKDPLNAVIASCAIPFLDGKLSLELEGKRYVDGAIAWPLPVRYCVETLHCTDLLVITPDPLQAAEEMFIDKIGNMLVPFFYPSTFTQLFHDRLQRHNEEIEYLTKSSHAGVRICTLYPQHTSLSWLSEDRAELKDAERVSKVFMQNLLAAHRKR